jgi:hypothetical protein
MFIVLPQQQSAAIQVYVHESSRAGQQRAPMCAGLEGHGGHKNTRALGRAKEKFTPVC